MGRPRAAHPLTSSSARRDYEAEALFDAAFEVAPNSTAVNKAWDHYESNGSLRPKDWTALRAVVAMDEETLRREEMDRR